MMLYVYVFGDVIGRPTSPSTVPLESFITTHGSICGWVFYPPPPPTGPTILMYYSMRGLVRTLLGLYTSVL